MSEVNEVVVTIPNVKFVGEPTKLLEAIGKASEKFLPVPKSADGQIGTQRFKYAPYHMVMRCIRPELQNQGVTITQPLSTSEGKAVSTLLVSGHGAIIISIFEFTGKYERITKDGRTVEDPQEFGKNSTYYRRYQLQSFFGLEGDKDADDPDVEAEAHVAKAPVEQKPKQERVQTVATDSSQTKPVTEVQKSVEKADLRSVNAKLTDAMKQLGWDMLKMNDFSGSLGFEGPAIRLSDNDKLTLFNKLVELKGVVPF